MQSLIPFTARVCTRDRATGRSLIAAGDGTLAILAAGNRDPAIFAEPARFDPDRQHNPHLAFGAGPHHCLGAPLVRRATATMVTLLVRQLPDLRRAAGRDSVSRGTVIPRGLASLPVTW